MAAWPAVADAIRSRAQAVVALPAGRVLRGYDTSTSPDDAVLVGLQNVDDEDWTSAGTFRQSMQTFGGNREEVGSVNCLVYASDGDGDLGQCTDTALGYLAAIEADVRADKTLGLTAFEYVVAEIDSGEIRETHSLDGAFTALPFVISYKVRI